MTDESVADGGADTAAAPPGDWDWVDDEDWGGVEDTDAAGDSLASDTPDDATADAEQTDDTRDGTDRRPTVVSRERLGSRWRVWLGGALGLVGLGLAYGAPSAVAAAVVPLAYVAYAAVSALPATASLRAERAVADRQITPGDAVPVTLTVENDGDAVLTDVRVVDGVPEELGVVGGSPRAALSLRPGETATLRYEVVARRGSYPFDSARVRLRSLAGSDAATLSVPVGGDDAVGCTAPAATVSVSRAAPLGVGAATADTGGEGLEFHSTRAYRHGDPRSRINWRQYAKRRRLVTTEFREERAGRAVVLLDVRPPTRRSAAAAYPTGAEYAAYAAEAAVARLRADGDEVSLAVLGLSPDAVSVPVATAGEAVWVRRADGADGRRRTRETLAAAAAVAGDRTRESPGEGGYGGDTPRGTDTAAASLVARCPDGAEVVVVSPFPDAVPTAYARRFAVAGHAVSVIAPDNTGGDSLGGRTASVARRLRLRDARPLCRTVVDWPGDRPLGLAVVRALAGGGGR